MTKLKAFILIIFAIVLGLLASQKVYGEEMIPGYATAYDLPGITASGEEVRDGICASSSNRLGCKIMLFKRLPDNSVGDLIGVYDCLDTGGTKGIKSGHVIDVWKKDLNSCQEFMNYIYEDGCQGKVWIKVIERKES